VGAARNKNWYSHSTHWKVDNTKEKKMPLSLSSTQNHDRLCMICKKRKSVNHFNPLLILMKRTENPKQTTDAS